MGGAGAATAELVHQKRAAQGSAESIRWGPVATIGVAGAAAGSGLAYGAQKVDFGGRSVSERARGLFTDESYEIVRDSSLG